VSFLSHSTQESGLSHKKEKKERKKKKASKQKRLMAPARDKHIIKETRGNDNFLLLLPFLLFCRAARQAGRGVYIYL